MQVWKGAQGGGGVGAAIAGQAAPAAVRHAGLRPANTRWVRGGSHTREIQRHARCTPLNTKPLRSCSGARSSATSRTVSARPPVWLTMGMVPAGATCGARGKQLRARGVQHAGRLGRQAGATPDWLPQGDGGARRARLAASLFARRRLTVSQRDQLREAAWLKERGDLQGRGARGGQVICCRSLRPAHPHPPPHPQPHPHTSIMSAPAYMRCARPSS